ncbi:hypothetical protein HYALB_00013307 [Hymenoscyphus albidus]|uniref:Uncharacterized protein n=1 Tax=Hymenoscyphus albidus TaxID=595503 RepID=A0A9N9LXF7_9HELO|nr:hypothetical protein HYALB_00013307 [Hymenoscyphus albidus]
MLISQIFAIGAILLHSVVAIPLAATKDATPEVQLSQRSTHRPDWPKAPHRRSVNSPQHERRLFNPLTPTKAVFRKVFGKGKKTKTKPEPPQAAAPKPIPEWQKPYKPPPTYSYYEPLPVPKPMPPAAKGNTPYKPPPTYSYDNIKRRLSRRSSRSKVARRSKKAHLL